MARRPTPLAAGLALALAACGGGGGVDPREIAPVGVVAEFRLTDQDGRPFGLEQLHGKVWVADFFFTSCPSFCPQLTTAMAELAAEFAPEPRLGFLSVTVDPATDTPEVLRAHAERLRLPQERWRFLTGSSEDLFALCERSFHLAFGELDPSTGEILHSSKFVLVDAAGRVRGYFDPLDPAQRPRLSAAVRAVLAEPVPGP